MAPRRLSALGDSAEIGPQTQGSSLVTRSRGEQGVVGLLDN